MSWLIEVDVTRKDLAFFHARFRTTPITIGSAVDNDVVLSGRQVRAHHAVLNLAGGGLEWRDASDGGSRLHGQSMGERTDLGLRNQVEISPFTIDLRLTTTHKIDGPETSVIELDSDEPDSDGPDFESPDTRPIIEAVELVEPPADLVNTAGEAQAEPADEPAPKANDSSTQRLEKPISATHDAHPLLVVTDGPRRLAGQRLKLPPAAELVLGRGADCHLRIADPAVSRRHAAIRRDAEDRCHLHDLGSVNGLFVNGEQILEVVLEDGDEIRLGTLSLTFLAAAGNGRWASAAGPLHAGIVRCERQAEEPAVIALHGRIENRGSESLATVLEDALTDEYLLWLIIDAKQVRRLGQAVLGLLAAADHELCLRGGGVLLAGAPATVRQQVAASALAARLRGRLVADRDAAFERASEITPADG